jgi:hypothetical protein
MIEIRTYRGTWDEIASHKDELPDGALLEMHVFAPESISQSGQSVYERFKDVIGTVEGLPADMSERPEKYMQGFGEDSRPGTVNP